MDYAEFFEEVTDYRVQGRCLQELGDILLLVLCRLLSDCETVEDIYDYACDKEATLRAFMDLPAGIPSHDTLNRVFRRLAPTELERCLSQWGHAIVALLRGRHLIIDGKQLRGTTPAGQRQAPVQLVSVRAAEQRLCLAQTAVAAKHNELVAIPQVLDLVEVSGSVVTLDALGCQRAVAAKLREKGADYVLALKLNQGDLHRQVVAHFAPLLAAPAAAQQRDKGHGRGELRRVWVSQQWGLVDAGADWPGLQTLVCQQTTRWVAGQAQAQTATRYFLSSLAGASAATLAGYVRGHWSSKNQQHWHLDVTFAEDASQCRRDHAPRNLSTMRKLALTLLRRSPLVMSLKRKRKKTARDDQFLRQLLAQLPVEENTPAS